MDAVGSRAFKNHTPLRRPVPRKSGPRQPEELSESQGRPSSSENLDSRDCADISVVESVEKLDKLGKEQCQKYVKDVLKDRSSSIHNPIKKNNLPLFRKNHKKATSKQGKKTAVLQSNLNLFTQLYVTLQNREGDMREFFSHEVQSFPPALSEFGNLRLPSAKSDLLKCLQPNSYKNKSLCSFCRVWN